MVIALTFNLQECQELKFKKIPNFILQNTEKQMVPCKSTAEEVSFEWSHHRISSTDTKVRATTQVSKIDRGSESVKYRSMYML